MAAAGKHPGSIPTVEAVHWEGIISIPTKPGSFLNEQDTPNKYSGSRECFCVRHRVLAGFIVITGH